MSSRCPYLQSRKPKRRVSQPQADNEDLRRFDKFINYRGVKRVRVLVHSPNSIGSDDVAAQLEERANRARLLHQAHGEMTLMNFEFDPDLDDNRITDYFGLVRDDDNPDADHFYESRRESFDAHNKHPEPLEVPPLEDVCDDREYEYVAFDKYGDRRYSNNSKHCIPYTNETFESDSKGLPRNPQVAFNHWDYHDPVTRKEVCQVKETIDEEAIEEEEDASSSSSTEGHDSGNGGVYDPFRPEFTRINTTDRDRIVELSPGAKFRDLTRLQYSGVKKVFGLENVRKYKNNLTAIISAGTQKYLVASSNSELLLYSFDAVTALPNRRPVLRFDTRPTFTLTSDRIISTWPYFPHTINFIKVRQWMGKEVLGACVDDSSVLIWFTSDIIPCIDKFGVKSSQGLDEPSSIINDDGYNENNMFYGFKIHPDFRIKLDASAWGLDFLSYQDAEGTSHHLMVASDNSQSISLLYYHQQDERFYHVRSHQVLHNIPEVLFLDWSVESLLHTVQVACSSISGELIVFSFSFVVASGPLNRADFHNFRREPTYYIDPVTAHAESGDSDANDLLSAESRSTRFPRVIFNPPTVVSRTMLGEDCWTVKPINLRFFFPVQLIRAMTGDPWIKEENEVTNIINELRILDLEFDPVVTSHLGLAALWQFFETPVVNLSTLDRQSLFETSKLTTIDDDYRRIHKGVQRIYNKIRSHEQKPSLNGFKYRLSPDNITSDNILLVSTSRKTAMFRADTLFCNCSTKQVFDLRIPFNEESRYSNRISITEVIPELSCFIIVTQQGLVSIMRLCLHRGLRAMRQEHIFPNALTMALGQQGYRTVAGLAITEVLLTPLCPRFNLYLTYTDGVVIVYTLGLAPTGELELT